MLEQVVAAPFAIIRRPFLLVIAILLAFMQGVLTVLFADSVGVFVATLSTLQISFSVDFILGLVVFLIGSSIPLYLHAFISKSINEGKTPSTIPMGLAGSSLALGVVLAVLGLAALEIGIFINGVISQTDGWLSLIGVIIFILLSLLVFFALLKFMFVPSYLGKGFPIKEAFSESWSLTTGKLFSVFIISLILLGVGIIAGSIPAFLPFASDNEWVSLLIGSLFAGLTGCYSATLLALIVGQDKNPHSYSKSRHAHPTKGE